MHFICYSFLSSTDICKQIIFKHMSHISGPILAIIGYNDCVWNNQGYDVVYGFHDKHRI